MEQSTAGRKFKNRTDEAVIDDGVKRLVELSSKRVVVKHPIMNKIFSRLFVMVLFTMLQLLFFYALVGWFGIYSGFAFLLNIAVGLFCIIYIYNTTTTLESKMAWTAMMAIFPLMGLLFYLYTRLNFFEKKRFRTLEDNITRTSTYAYTGKAVESKRSREDIDFQKLANYADKIGHLPTYRNTDVNYYALGKMNAAVNGKANNKKDDDLLIRDVREAISNAKKFIFFEFFIVDRGRLWSEILELLLQKAREGVEVRIIYDDMGCISTMPRKYRSELERLCRLINENSDGNGKIVTSPWAPIRLLFSTIYNNRDHRKILVIDGVVAFSGGFNIADEYINELQRFGVWKDNAFRVRGDAVRSYTLMFLQMWNVYEDTESHIDEDGILRMDLSMKNNFGKLMDWYLLDPHIEAVADPAYRERKARNDEENGYVIPYSDGPHLQDNVAENIYMDAINAARKNICIMTPYLIPDEKLLHAIKHAKKSGIDVKIIIPGEPDKKTVYMLTKEFARELAEAGVEVYIYTHGFVHTKLVIVDGEFAATGTVNLDYRSLYLHFECGLVIYRKDVLNDIISDFNETAGDSVLLDITKKENIFSKLWVRFLRVFVPLL